jgi:hypothetical protein
MQMQELFLNAALQGDVKALGSLIKEREDVLHWRNENGETVADEYRRALGPSADRRISMLLAPPFEPAGFVMPVWFFISGGWETAGITW